MLWNVNRASDVREIHDVYRSAGSDLITTNSFGGSSFMLNRHGLADRTEELNRAAAEIARAAAGEAGWVLGDVGPFGDFLQPIGETTPEQLRFTFPVSYLPLLIPSKAKPFGSENDPGNIPGLRGVVDKGAHRATVQL